MKFSEQLKDVEVFETGTWNGFKFVEDDLDAIVSNSNDLIAANKEKPMLKLGHSKKQILDQSDGQPALGWMHNLRKKGNKIIADFSDVPAIVVKAIKNKLYNKVSIELSHSKHFGYYATALSLLGADLPAVKTLQDLDVFLASDEGRKTSNNKNEFEPKISKEENKVMDDNDELDFEDDDEKEFDKHDPLEDLKRKKKKKKTKKKLDDDETETEMENKKMSEELSKENADLKAKLIEMEKEKEAAQFSEESSKVLSKLEKDVDDGFLMPSVFSDIKEMIKPDKLNFSEGKLSFDQDFILKLSEGYKEKLKTTESTPLNDKSKDVVDQILEMKDKVMSDLGITANEALNHVLERNPDLRDAYHEKK